MPRPLHNSVSDLFSSWCEGLLRAQIDAPADAARNGGLLCPDCRLIHGRCGDALYPFLRMARQSGDPKWIDAAIAVQLWSDQVSREDGAFENDRPGNPWTGITVFAAIALGEALHFHGELLPANVRARWENRLRRAASWIQNLDWADHGTINYPISAAAALASASRALGDEKLLETARGWANWSRDSFLPDGILFGEGPRAPSPRSVYAVDPLYNLEESLPNLALYAEIADDQSIRDLVLQSFVAHLDFVLPDGSYDAGWGSRAFNWTPRGSRTSDGLAGLLPLARFEPRIAEAVRRNVEYLGSCTSNGLLYGGPHLEKQGRAACIHHTFTHAKALAFALDAGFFPNETAETVELPCDAPRGVVYRENLGIALVSLDSWRASFTVSDVFYNACGWRASGGAPTLIWHPKTGPICVASMSGYRRIEGVNMAELRAPDEIATLTPRLQNGDFSSERDLSATLGTQNDGVCARGRLTDLQNQVAGKFSLETRFEGDKVTFHAQVESPSEGAIFHLPIVSPSDEKVEWSAHRIEIHKSRARLVIESSAAMSGETSRVFHFVPGVQAVPIAIQLPAGGAVVSLRVVAL